MAAPSSPSRCFMFTVNNPSHPEDKDDLISWVEGEDIARYIVFQLERGAAGTEHYQGYLELNAPQRFTWLHRHFPLQAHVERARIPTAAENYCMKEDTRVEGPWTAGERIARGRPEGAKASKKEKYDLLKTAIKEGKTKEECMDLDPVFFLQHPSAFNQMLQEFAPMGGVIEREIVLMYGPTGTGKSKWARDAANEQGLEYYNKPKSMWWNMYRGQKYVILDDFGAGWGMTLAELLGMLDMYDDVLCQPKGTYVPMRAKFIVFTSNVHPYKWFKWEDREDERPALARRFCAVYYMPALGEMYRQTDPAEIKNFFDDPNNVDWKWE